MGRGVPATPPEAWPCLLQVPGCGEELVNGKHYYRRYRICQHHSTLPSMVLDGRRQRFCQQCELPLL